MIDPGILEKDWVGRQEKITLPQNKINSEKKNSIQTIGDTVISRSAAVDFGPCIDGEG